jgi:hypothetical protein
MKGLSRFNKGSAKFVIAHKTALGYAINLCMESEYFTECCVGSEMFTSHKSGYDISGFLFLTVIIFTLWYRSANG